MLSEQKRKFQHRFRSKCYGNTFPYLPPQKNLEVISLPLIPESDAPLVTLLHSHWRGEDMGTSQKF